MDEREIELKLLATPAALRRLQRQPWLRELKQGRAVTRTLRTQYFDTPDGTLRAAGVAVRVRSIGRHRIQTVKTGGESLGGISVRGEWEREIAGDRPEAAALADTPLAPLFAPATVRALRPTVATAVRRTEMLVDGGQALITLAFDTGSVSAGDRTLPLAEVELELRQGPPRALFDLALRLHEAAPLRIGRASKFERGMRLLDPRASAPCRWTGSPVSPGSSAADAFRAVARACLDQLAANEDCLLESGDPEAVHQARVALRRLRAAIGGFRDMVADGESATVEHGLRALLRRLGPARDAEVFVTEILAPPAAHLRDSPELARLREVYEARRAAGESEAREALLDPAFTRLCLQLGAWIEGGDWLAESPAESVEAAAARILDRRRRKVRKAAARFADMTESERHALRISLKKLRYAAEMFLPLFPGKPSRRHVAAVAGLQQILGELNDIAVARSDLAATLHHGDAELRHAAGLVVGWHARREKRLLAKAAKACERLRKLPRFWKES